MSYNFLDKTGLAYFWGKIKDYIAKITRNDLAVITSKEYSGIYGSANDQAGASATSGQSVRIEGENAVKMSSQMLYPRQDQSSPAVYLIRQ